MDKKLRINMAAIGALRDGNLENFITAATPGGIEAQEAAGQRTFVNNATLPKKCPRAELEAMGVVFGGDADDLFVNVTLPSGWKKQPTEHSMWSDLLDDQGRKRGAIFYKAAFYDRSAHMDVCRCVNVQSRYGDDDSFSVAVVRGGEVLFETETIKRDYKDPAYFQRADALEDAARTWADEHYPDWRNPLAYWDVQQETTS